MDSNADQELFLERLETLYEKELSDVRAFAQREHRPYHEVRPSTEYSESSSFEHRTPKVRLRLAELHCKELFSLKRDEDDESPGKERISNILRSVSQALESLLSIGGLQSFFLVVNPSDANDEGFLGGTMLGREFWRGHRGCGAAGARAFRTYCQKSHPAQVAHAHDTLPLNLTNYTYPSNHRTSGTPPPPVQPALSTAAPSKSGPASALKTEVYAAMRNAVRKASGNRTAEMKWTNHSNLEPYGIALEGWPHGIPNQNPSSLSTAQNRQILEALANGTLRFVPLQGVAGPSQQSHFESSGTSNAEEEANVFADTVDFSWDEEETSKVSTPTTTSAYSNRDPAVGGSVGRASGSREFSAGLTGGQRSGSESATSVVTYSRDPSPWASAVGRKRKREGSRT